jgi:hypothetical protein
VLRELEAIAIELEERRVAREKREAERRAAGESARGRARIQAIEAYRVDVLRRRVDDWQKAELTMAYCDDVLARYGSAVDRDPAATRWIAFARECADKLQELTRMPEDPALRDEDLKLYMRG